MTIAKILKGMIEAWSAWAEMFDGFPMGADFGAFLALMMIAISAGMLGKFIWDYMSVE